MFNILVVEDNQVERKNLVRLLKNLNSDVCIYEADTGEKAMKILKEETIELFFLDIELPDTTGLKIAEKIRAIPQYELTYIVFITTHVYYQLEAFKQYHCYDFIEKPYQREEMIKISDRLIKGISRQSHKEKAVGFDIKNCILKVALKDILFIESQRRSCIVYTKDNQYTIPNMSMKKALEKIKASSFMQTHKSYIVNMDNIHLIEKHEKSAWLVYFKDCNVVAHISDKYKKKFSERFFS